MSEIRPPTINAIANLPCPTTPTTQLALSQASMIIHLTQHEERVTLPLICSDGISEPSRRPTPDDWGLNMTVCIAVKTKDSIVAVCDEMLSHSIISGDRAAFKFRRLHDRWFTLFATSRDAGIIDPLTSKLRAELRSLPENTLDKVGNACASAFAAELREQITRAILSRYNLTIEQFLQNGLQYFGPVLFGEIREEIDQYTIGVELLIGGFDDAGESHIFTVTDRGVIQYRDVVQKWAIGSGAWTAIGVLMRDPLLSFFTLDHVIYVACQAKFLAETALGVGKSTQAFVFHKDGNAQLYQDDKLRPIKALWESEGQAPIPYEALKAINDLITQNADPAAGSQ